MCIPVEAQRGWKLNSRSGDAYHFTLPFFVPLRALVSYCLFPIIIFYFSSIHVHTRISNVTYHAVARSFPN